MWFHSRKCRKKIIRRTSNDDLNCFEEDLKNRLTVENSICNYTDNENDCYFALKTMQPMVSLMHLFIELLNWNGMHCYIVVIYKNFYTL